MIDERFTEREQYLMGLVHSTFKPSYVYDGDWDAALQRWLEDGVADGGIEVADQILKEAPAVAAEPDVSDELLGYAIAALNVLAERCERDGCEYENCRWGEMLDKAKAVKKARVKARKEAKR